MRGKHLKKQTKSNSIMQTAGFLMIMMSLSRILGYVRDAVILAGFGQDYRTDAYYAAFNIPDFIYSILLGGALGSAFIPVLTSYIAKGKEEDSWIVASSVFNVVLLAVSAAIAIGMIFTPQLMNILVPGYDAQTKALAVTLTRIMFIQCFFMCLVGIGQGICHSYRQFTAPAVGSVLYNISIIVLGVLLKDKLGIAAFTIGVAFGAFLNFAVQIPTMYRVGMKYRPIITFRHEGVRQFYRLLVPVVIGLSAVNFNTFVSTNLGSALDSGVVTALNNAQRLIMLPIGIFAVSIAVAGFPTMTAHAAKGEMDAYKKDLGMSIKTILFINLPAAIGMAVLRVPLVRAMYKQGNFSFNNLDVTADILLFYCIGLVGYAAQQVLNRGFYAVQDTKTPVSINVSVILLNIGMSIAFVRFWGYRGLALAYSLAGLISMVLLMAGLQRKVGHIGLRNIAISASKSLLAAALMGVIVWLMRDYMEISWDMTNKAAQIMQLVLCVCGGAVSYALTAYLLKMEEVHIALRIILRKLHRAG